MSLSRGWPGWILFSMPSRPAISIAADAREPYEDGSGDRNSRRFAFGEGEYIGMRIDAERLRAEYARLIGASKPGTSRLYEFVVGQQSAASAGPCLRMPPMYHIARSDSPAYPSPAKSGLPFFQMDWCTCIPEPLSP